MSDISALDAAALAFSPATQPRQCLPVLWLHLGEHGGKQLALTALPELLGLQLAA